MEKSPGISQALFGESVWGSNPPGRLPAAHTGFEDREAHRDPSAPIYLPDKPSQFVKIWGGVV